LILPGELEGHIADAEVYGPWWEVRADVLSAAVRHAVLVAGGAEVRFSDCLIDWDQEPAPLSLVSWEEASAMISATIKKG
jgi:hypothetical protein